MVRVVFRFQFHNGDHFDIISSSSASVSSAMSPHQNDGAPDLYLISASDDDGQTCQQISVPPHVLMVLKRTQFRRRISRCLFFFVCAPDGFRVNDLLGKRNARDSCDHIRDTCCCLSGRFGNVASFCFSVLRKIKTRKWYYEGGEQSSFLPFFIFVSFAGHSESDKL